MRKIRRAAGLRAKHNHQMGPMKLIMTIEKTLLQEWKVMPIDRIPEKGGGQKRVTNSNCLLWAVRD